MKCSDIEKQLEKLVPKKVSLEAGNENTGLIVGRSDKNVSTIIITYCVDQEVVDYAISVQADMIVSYEPIIKTPILKIGSGSYEGRLLLQLLRYDIACYATGSSFDLCKGGTADWIASKLELSGVSATEPLIEYEGIEGTICQSGFGRIGHYKKKKTFEEIVDNVTNEFSQEIVRVYGFEEDDELPVSDVAVSVWADEKSLDLAMMRGAQLIVTCGVGYQDAMKACGEHRTILELSGSVAEEGFCECTEQYLSDVLSSSIEILTVPTRRKCRFLRSRKE